VKIHIDKHQIPEKIAEGFNKAKVAIYGALQLNNGPSKLVNQTTNNIKFKNNNKDYKRK